MHLSPKGRALIALYETMAARGYERVDGARVDTAFSDFELRPFRAQVREFFREQGVAGTLDYGCGGSDWDAPGFDEESGASAVDYFGLDEARRYEPARGIDERAIVDCVVSFDVLEHIFISDVPNTLRDMFKYARKAVLLNIACYPAAATLPNGENAHITVRPPLWWKGMVDAVACEFPEVAVLLLCSEAWRQLQAFPVSSGKQWQQSETFVVGM